MVFFVNPRFWVHIVHHDDKITITTSFGMTEDRGETPAVPSVPTAQTMTRAQLLSAPGRA